MKRQPLITKDGSTTLSVPAMNVTYHSVHGAIQESKHVFIEAGLKYYSGLHPGLSLRIFEMGFGTGLNALLTFLETAATGPAVHYEAVETHPLEAAEVQCLNYCSQLNQPGLQLLFEQLHGCAWNEDVPVSSRFTICKRKEDLLMAEPSGQTDLVYYDAFAPAAQPELWSKDVFEKLFFALKPGGILVTYCSKGAVRRAMQAAGFLIEKIPGPPGKREMVRAARPA